MFRENDKVNTREVVFFILASIIEAGTLVSARVYEKEVGPDAWLAQIAKYLLWLIPTFIIVKLGQRFYRHGFVEYSGRIVGRAIGWIFSASMVVYWLFVSAKLLYIFSSTVKLSLLDKTPRVVIVLPILLLAIYIGWYGFEPLCRLSLL